MNTHNIPSAAAASDDEMHMEARAKQGYFWPDGPPPEPDAAVLARNAHLDPYADKSGLIHLARSFLNEVTEQAERFNPVKLGDPIGEDEWWSARSSQPPIVDRWFYEDVGCFIAPGAVQAKPRCSCFRSSISSSDSNCSVTRLWPLAR